MAAGAADGQRFASLSEAEIEELIFQKDAKNTRQVIDKALKLLNTYCAEKAVALPEDRPSNAELDELLAQFYAESRKQNGDFYAKKSLLSARYGLQRHFDSTRGIDIVHDRDFKYSNTVYKSMLVKMKNVGKGSVKHKNVIQPEDLEKIYTSSALDQSTPRGLQNKVFVDYMLHFANRGRENLREMTTGDLEIQTDPSGSRYVELVVDKLTKTDRGEGDNEGQGGRMYETPEKPNLCPVSSFERYVSALHPDCEAFWQRPKRKALGKTSWYDNSPVGKNTLYNKTKVICAEADVSRPYTNHCLRATAVTALDDAGYQARDIMTVSGHRSEASIRSYSRTSERKKKDMSAALSSLMPAEQPDENRPSTSSSAQALTVPVKSVAVFDPSTNTVTLPPLIVEAESEPQMDASFDLDFDDSFLLTSSQDQMVLQELTNSPT